MTDSQFNHWLQTIYSKMITVIGIVLICVVNVVTGDGGNPEVCTSPVALNKKEAKCGQGDGRPKVDFGEPFHAVVTNNGSWESAVKVGIAAGDKRSVHIGTRDYVFVEFHFHVGVDPAQGSQHTIEGKYLQMEMHIPLSRGGPNNEGVLGFFIDLVEHDNAAFEAVINAVKELHKFGDTKDATINLKEIVAPAIDGPYYQYSGTSQLPPCSYTLLWTFYETPLQMSAAQLQEIRRMNITSAYRPLAPLNERPLHHFDKKC